MPTVEYDSKASSKITIVYIVYIFYRFVLIYNGVCNSLWSLEEPPPETSKTISFWGHFIYNMVIYWIAILFIGITFFYRQVQPPY